MAAAPSFFVFEKAGVLLRAAITFPKAVLSKAIRAPGIIISLIERLAFLE